MAEGENFRGELTGNKSHTEVISGANREYATGFFGETGEKSLSLTRFEQPQRTKNNTFFDILLQDNNNGYNEKGVVARNDKFVGDLWGKLLRVCGAANGYPPGEGFAPEKARSISLVTDAYGFLASREGKFDIDTQYLFWKGRNKSQENYRNREQTEKNRQEWQQKEDWRGYSNEGITLTEEESRSLLKLANYAGLSYDPNERFFSFSEIPQKEEAKKILHQRWLEETAKEDGITVQELEELLASVKR